MAKNYFCSGWYLLRLWAVIALMAHNFLWGTDILLPISYNTF